MARLFRRAALVAAALAAWTCVAGAAHAQSARHDRDVCFNVHSDPEATIAACTGALSSGILGTYTQIALAHADRAWAYLAARRDAAHAIPDYTRAIELYPITEFYFNRAIAYRMQNDDAAALSDLNDAVRLGPRFPQAFLLRGEVRHESRDYAGAIADFERVLELDPADLEAMRLRCTAGAQWGARLEQALADCDTLLAGHADDADGLGARGLVHLRRDEWEAALGDFDRALQMRGDWAEALYGRGLARRRLRAGEGDADLSAAIARDGDVAVRFAGYGFPQ